MTVLEATQRILAGWLRRESEIQRRLTEIRDEQIALTSLLRTVERQRVGAELAVRAARDGGAPAGSGSVRGGSGAG